MLAEVWWGNLREKRPLEIPRHRWEDNTKLDLHEVGCTGHGHERNTCEQSKWTSEFHKMPGFSWLVEKLSGSEEGLCCVELDTVYRCLQCGTRWRQEWAWRLQLLPVNRRRDARGAGRAICTKFLPNAYCILFIVLSLHAKWSMLRWLTSCSSKWQIV